jgi:hypothetical protein
MMTESAVREKYLSVAPALDERLRRLWAGAEANQFGHGGIVLVMRATGLSYPTVARGMREAASGDSPLLSHQSRLPGGGRKNDVTGDPKLRLALEALIDPLTRGDPQSALRWTCKSTRVLAKELQAQGFSISHASVATLLHSMEYSLQSNSKTREGVASHPDRNAQFEYINAQAQASIAEKQPVVSVDTKKKELVGDFKNDGVEWQPEGKPEPVQVHDFPKPGEKKAIPYGVYDLAQNTGWVSVGVDHDTAKFSTATIGRWWEKMGKLCYPKASKLLITADGGGSNGSRLRLWKFELQELADRTGLSITVCHFPPGTSKWNKIEHRLFSFLAKNWRGRPLLTLATIVNLIAATRTEKGLRVECELDCGSYPLGTTVSDKQMAEINCVPHAFHGEWNYTIHPRSKPVAG